jgi:hypothetical protein
MEKINIEKSWQPTQAEIEKIKNQIIAPVVNGEMEVVRAVVLIRALRDALEEAENNLKEEMVTQLSNYAKNDLCTMNGVTITPKEVGVKYSYDECGDTLLDDMVAEHSQLGERIKDRQKFLKSIKDIEIVVDKVTGEICELRPPSKKSTSSYVITFPKS